MKPILLIFLLIGVPNIEQSMAQTKQLIQDTDYKIQYEESVDQDILVGEINASILEEFKPDWAEAKEEYEVDTAHIETIQKNLPSYDIIVFLGTWCGDSHHWVPQFLKILEQIDYPMEKMRIYAVDRAKQALNVESNLYEIERVPTFIFVQDNTEKGRIVESVENNLEDWMFTFLEQ